MPVNRPISYFKRYFKRSFKDILTDISQFGAHSSRADGSSAAANVGVKDRRFQHHSSWKTVSVKYGCANDNFWILGFFSITVDGKPLICK